jgi:hypothetical protein
MGLYYHRKQVAPKGRPKTPDMNFWRPGFDCAIDGQEPPRFMYVHLYMCVSTDNKISQ